MKELEFFVESLND